jgi:hypothetical protein
MPPPSGIVTVQRRFGVGFEVYPKTSPGRLQFCFRPAAPRGLRGAVSPQVLTKPPVIEVSPFEAGLGSFGQRVSI